YFFKVLTRDAFIASDRLLPHEISLDQHSDYLDYNASRAARPIRSTWQKTTTPCCATLPCGGTTPISAQSSSSATRCSTLHRYLTSICNTARSKQKTPSFWI
ncbi:MAG: hypothetical protein P8M07_04350, partial [Flavobacteriales bacterium]|nr:hypothetical protein [Flavobacteriales bacterium]